MSSYDIVILASFLIGLKLTFSSSGILLSIHISVIFLSRSFDSPNTDASNIDSQLSICFKVSFLANDSFLKPSFLANGFTLSALNRVST